MRTVAALILVLASSSLFAHELDEEFPGMVSASNMGGSIVVEYCPDNTCEVFTVAVPADIQEIQDFAFMHLFTRSPYNYLKEFRQSGRTGRLGAVLDRYSAGCPQVQAQEAARCVMNRIAAKYEIQVEFIRYDEGGRHTGSVNLY